MLSYTSICVRSKISISHRLWKVAQALRAAVPTTYQVATRIYYGISYRARRSRPSSCCTCISRVSSTCCVTRGTLYGSLSIFDPAVEEWCEYTERFTHYFVVNDIVAVEKRRAIFLTAVGPTTYRLLKTLVSPSKLDEFRFEELVEKAMTHFNPKPSPIVKRYEFNSRAKKEDQSASVYIAELPNIAQHCEFGAVLNEMLRDRLVCGTNNRSI